MDCSLGFKSENQEVKLRSYSPSGGLRPYKSYAVRIFSYTHFEEMIVNLKLSYFKKECKKSSCLPKYKQKIVKISALTAQGRNPEKFLFVFWEKRWLHEFILKLSDLYC